MRRLRTIGTPSPVLSSARPLFLRCRCLCTLSSRQALLHRPPNDARQGQPGPLRRRACSSTPLASTSSAPDLRSTSAALSNAAPSRPKTAIFFPGQGVQKVGMLTPWLEAFPRTARPFVEEMDECMGFKLSAVIQDGPNRLLNMTSNAQPAIMATSILVLRVLEREFGWRAAERVDVTLGHSLGEFAALVAGGYLHFEDSLWLVRQRAEAMTAATRQAAARNAAAAGATGAAGDAADAEDATTPSTASPAFTTFTQSSGSTGFGMVAVVTEPEYLEPLIAGVRRTLAAGGPAAGQVAIANINSKNQIVLSGHLGHISSLLAQVCLFLGHDPRAVRLNSDSPFHSPVMRPVVAEMRRLLAGPSRVKHGHGNGKGDEMVTFPGLLPCISNVTARPFSSRAELKDLLARQCEETVRWWDSIRYLDQDRAQRVRRWVGIGPGKVGRNLVGKEVGMRGKDLVKGGGVWAITDPSEIEEMLRGLDETEPFMAAEEEEAERVDEAWRRRYSE